VFGSGGGWLSWCLAEVFLGLGCCPGASERVRYVDTPCWRMLLFYRTSRLFRCGRCVWMVNAECVWIFPDTRVADRFSSLVRFAGLSESLRGVQICWDLQGSCIWSTLQHQVLTIGSLPTGVPWPSTFGAASWNLMGRVILIRVRKLVSSGVS
jgi:hypothetical protein